MVGRHHFTWVRRKKMPQHRDGEVKGCWDLIERADSLVQGQLLRDWEVVRTTEEVLSPERRQEIRTRPYLRRQAFVPQARGKRRRTSVTRASASAWRGMSGGEEEGGRKGANIPERTHVHDHQSQQKRRRRGSQLQGIYGRIRTCPMSVVCRQGTH